MMSRAASGGGSCDRNPVYKPLMSATRSGQPTLREIFARRALTRREFLLTGGKLGLAAALVSMPGCGLPKPASGPAKQSAALFDFKEIAKSDGAGLSLAPGYRAEVLIRWGDRLDGGSGFNPLTLTPEEQARRFGYNNDFTAFLPMTPGSEDSAHLWQPLTCPRDRP